MPEVLVKGCVAKGSKLLSSDEVVILSKTSKSSGYVVKEVGMSRVVPE